MDVLSQYAWIGWLVLILLFAVIEVFTLELTFLMLSLGSVAGLLAGLLSTDWWVQILVAAIAALGLLFLLRPRLLRRLGREHLGHATNVDALIGMLGTVVHAVSLAGGQVRLENGESWSAKSLLPGDALPVGSRVIVEAIVGAHAIVRTAETEAE
ncbi:MAG TPA: NfeD family protein [Candidatus Lumbricidophila sp.]|nr:NfeD family protein [Candidatus Lumbricidophila sp.]